MKIVDIHEAKTHLSRFVEKAAKGEPFVIAKAGQPLVKVMSLETPVAGKVRRLGFMTGRIVVPDHFGRIGRNQNRTASRRRPVRILLDTPKTP
jgi:prevent-host-death family protein